MMRSMGYYPTNKEIENMQNEIRFSRYLDPGEQVEELDLNMFLKLFVNHRPVYGIGKNQINSAITELAKGLNLDIAGEMPLAELKKILVSEGERMTAEEFDECLRVLCGENEEQIPQ